MKIKFVLRRNLLHLLQLILWNFIRKIETTLMSKFLGFGSSILNTLLMFLGEFLFGLILYVYQRKYLTIEKEKKKSPLLLTMTVRVKKKNSKIFKQDKLFQIYFFFFLCGFFDFVEFTLSLKSLSKFFTVSGSLEWRLTGILTISSSLCLFLLMKFDIFKHQKFSLIIIIATLVIIIVTEFIFQKIDIFLSYSGFFYALFIIFLIHIFTSLNDIIEKYLFEFNSLNEFKTLMWQGFFGFILTIFYCIYDSPFCILVDYYNEHSTTEFVFLIIGLILYVILSGGRNAYRVYVNKLYSPIVKTLTDYFLNPLYIIYYFCMGEDFIINGKSNWAYFLLNLIYSSLITFFGCVYNEIIVLYFCGLERDSYDEVCKRATKLERLSIPLEEFNEESVNNLFEEDTKE